MLRSLKRFFVSAGILSLVLTFSFVSNLKAAGIFITSPDNFSGWSITSASGGQIDFITSVGAPRGTGAVQLTTDETNDSRAALSHAYNVRLDEVSTISYSTKQLSVPAAAQGYADPAMRISIDTDGDGVLNDQLMYEPYYNGIVNGNWQNWDVKAGKFWSNYEQTYNGLGGPGAGSYLTNFSISDVLHDFPDAQVVGVVVSMGTWNPSWQTLVDNVNFNDDIYDFEPASPPAPVTPVPVQPPISNTGTGPTPTPSRNNFRVNNLVASGLANTSSSEVLTILTDTGDIALGVKDDSGDVLGATAQAENGTNYNFKLFGASWYWLLSGLGGFSFFLLLAYRQYQASRTFY